MYDFPLPKDYTTSGIKTDHPWITSSDNLSQGLIIMAFYEFTLTNFGDSKEALLNRVHEMGCLGVTDQGEKAIAYFKDNLDVIALRDGLNSFREVLDKSGLGSDFTFDYLYLAERDWNETWKKKFIPIDVGRNLSILPPWEKVNPNRIAIIIDPGMAFGTGHHETTRTCLALIEEFATDNRHDAFLDVGAGTGILPIAASRLGFRSVMGVDTDPLAVDAASRNADLNDLRNIEIRKGTISDVEGTFDMISANLISGTLIAIAHETGTRLRDGGKTILSGMLVGQEEEVIAAMEESGLRLMKKVIDDRWVSLVMERGGDYNISA